MPPKIQRKEGAADGATSGGSASKDNDVVSIDDILFPKATVSRIAKSVLAPESTTDGVDKSQFILSKDSLTVIQRSSVVFISHLFHNALQESKQDVRRTASAQDVLNALKKSGFNAYIPILEEELEKFNEKAAAKRQLKQSSAKAESSQADGEELDDGNEEDEDDDDEEDTAESKKKVKTNSGEAAEVSAKQPASEDIDEDSVEEVELEDEIVEDEVEEEEGDGEEEARKLKPSQILSQEHQELEGSTNESANENENEDEEEDE